MALDSANFDPLTYQDTEIQSVPKSKLITPKQASQELYDLVRERCVGLATKNLRIALNQKDCMKPEVRQAYEDELFTRVWKVKSV